MINPKHFEAEVITPTLRAMGKKFNTLAARRLLLGTAIKESGLRSLRQLGGGPALGLYQVEPNTHKDLFKNFLNYPSRHGLRETLKSFGVGGLPPPGHLLGGHLIANLAYATAAVRLIYWRRPEALPGADDFEGLAAYWKAHFNTKKGAGTAASFLRLARKHMENVT